MSVTDGFFRALMSARNYSGPKTFYSARRKHVRQDVAPRRKNSAPKRAPLHKPARVVVRSNAVPMAPPPPVRAAAPPARPMIKRHAFFKPRHSKGSIVGAMRKASAVHKIRKSMGIPKRLPAAVHKRKPVSGSVRTGTGRRGPRGGSGSRCVQRGKDGLCSATVKARVYRGVLIPKHRCKRCNTPGDKYCMQHLISHLNV